VTETDDLASALDAAAERWPDLSRPQLLVRLALEGARVAAHERAEHGRRRLAALHAHSGVATGVYESGYRERLREEWPT
jgi:hypothetical protein